MFEGVTNTQESIIKDLFGGAISVSLPVQFKDISDLAPVPDNQEVFQDLSSNTDVVFEVLEYSKSVPDEQSISYLFSDLGEQNRSPECFIIK